MSLTFIEKGSGFPLVLLHGYCENKSIWSSMMEDLSQKFKVIAIDLPGFGENKAVNEISIESAAHQVKDTLDLLKIPQCVMIGHSLGGYVTLAFAENYPSMLKGMGMFHSSAFADTEEKKQARNKTADFIKKNGMKLFASSFVEPLFFPARRKHLAEEIENTKEQVAACFGETVMAYAYAMRDRKERIAVLKEVGFPVLFIIGKGDMAVPLEASLDQCYLPRESVVQFLEDTAHMGMIERPNETSKIIQLFTTYCS